MWWVRLQIVVCVCKVYSMLGLAVHQYKPPWDARGAILRSEDVLLLLNTRYYAHMQMADVTLRRFRNLPILSKRSFPPESIENHFIIWA